MTGIAHNRRHKPSRRWTGRFANARAIISLFGRMGAAAAVLYALSATVPQPVDAAARSATFCFNNWPPYATATGGRASGITVDILREAARRLDYRIEFVEVPWNRCLAKVRNGDYDAVLDAAQRAEFLQGPVSVAQYTNTFWVRQDSPLERFDMSLLRGRSVGLVNGYEYPPALTEAFQDHGIKVDFAVDDLGNIKKLAFGRVDAIVADYAGTTAIIRDKGLPLRALSPTHSSDPLYLSFNPRAQDLHRAFNAALKELLDDGTVDAVYTRHIGSPLNGQDVD